MGRALDTRESGYILGHAADELDRLIEQARFFGDLTEDVLRLAGLGRGMRVLDIGCGTGDVSFLAARLVGPEGAVIGVDKSPEAVAAAQGRAERAGLANVRFLVGDAAELELDHTVDALIGRLVLMYFPDPAAVLRHVLRYLASGGIVACQEMDLSGTTSEPYCELVDATGRRIVETFTRAGIDPRAGLKLRRVFQAAGLPAPRMIQGARVEGGPDSPVYDYMAQTTRTLLPLIERTGVATAAEVGIETLAARLRQEVLDQDAVVVPPPLIGAWARKDPA